MALSALGDAFTQKVKKAKKIFVHPNMVSPGNRGACANVETVRGVLDHISLIRADKIKVGDTSFHNTKKGFKQLGYDTLSRSANIELVDLNDDRTIPSFAYDANMNKKPIGFSRTVADSDFNIVIVPAKMHSYTIATLSIKTQVVGSQVVRPSPFGIHARWGWNHTGYPQIHRTFAEVYQMHPADLAVIDGVEAMEGDGPTSGDLVQCRWTIASFNPVTADALAAYLMGLDPVNIGYLYLLDKKGFGPIDIKKMKILGNGKVDKLRKKLRLPSSAPEIFNWR
jgi:uncharacterized protein (DUF362 family)